MVHAFRIKTIFHWLDPRHFHKYAFFSLQAWEPHSYQLPGQFYLSQATGLSSEYRHQDYFRRRYRGWNEDRYLDPIDGRLRRLFAQTVDEVYDMPNDTSWRRTYISNISPRLLRVAYWPYSRMPDASSVHSTKHSIQGELKNRVETWDWKQWAQVAGCWLPACIGLLFIVSEPIMPHTRLCTLTLATRCVVPLTSEVQSATMAAMTQFPIGTGATLRLHVIFTKT